MERSSASSGRSEIMTSGVTCAHALLRALALGTRSARPVRNLLGAPPACPATVTAVRLVSPDPRRPLWTDRRAVGVAHCARQPILHIGAQAWVLDELAWLRPLGDQLRFPLGDRC